jgi:uncharacterized membrane protein YkvA (DUF1232 family)
MLQSWKSKAKQLKQEVFILWLAYRMPGVPWYAKAFGALVVAYALSPIDLIPDFIPVLGYVDDLILLPLGVVLAIKMIPAEVYQQARQEAAQRLGEDKGSNWIAGAVIVLVWLTVILLIVFKIFWE